MRSPIVFIATAAVLGCGTPVTPTGPSQPPPPPAPPPPQVLASVVIVPGDQTIYAIGATFQFAAIAIDANRVALDPQPTFEWTSTDELIATVDGTGGATTLSEGATSITATANGVSGSAVLGVEVVVLETVDSYLSTPAAGFLWEVPVLILRYLPSADGINLDVTKSPGFYGPSPVTLEQLRTNIDEFNERVKFSREEGSRFRGYNNPAALPSLGYRVVDEITVYEQVPAGPRKFTGIGNPVFHPDYHAIFARHDVENYVNSQGVKEVWLWFGPFTPDYPVYDPAIHDLADMRDSWESNMSSPVTGDVSNSDRDPTDLPVYGTTYVVYGGNFRRSQAEAVHVHGHQLESQYTYVNALQDGNANLFWQQFVGATGRSGWTHVPPNTTQHYDYYNPTLVLSDIADWTPDNSGTKVMVNVDTWGGQAYAWPGQASFSQRVESQWYIYWMQSMPGLANGIPHPDGEMTNWWAFTGDWDGAIGSGLGLHTATP